MKQKSKFRRFWNLDHRKSDGFTLVELIVVIAILAILGGATVPAYNLYVEKARESADNQVLAAVNTAFASACIEHRVDSMDITDAGVKVKDGTVHGLTYVKHTSENLDLESMNDSFMFFMRDNENTKFKSEAVETLTWEEDHFEILALLFSNGKNAILDADALAAFLNSAYGDMTKEEMKTILQKNIDLAKSILDASGLASLIGITIGDDKIIEEINDPSSFGPYFTDEQKKFIEDSLKVSDWGATNEQKANKSKARQMVANAALLYAADNLNGKSAEGMANHIANSSSNPRKAVSEYVSTGGMGGTLVQSAVSAGLYESFIRSEAGKNYNNESCKNAIISTDDYNAQTGILVQRDKYNNTQKEAMKAFDAWIQTEEGKQEAAGFMGSMQLVSDNKNVIGQENVINNGLSDSDVDTLIGTITSQNT